jgi:hypothetical protein
MGEFVEGCVHTCKWASEAFEFVTKYLMTHGSKDFVSSIAIDQYLVDLWL